MSPVPTFKLSSGADIPALAYGTGTSWFKRSKQPFNDELVQATKKVLDLGYRHLDAAESYGNEAEVGAGIKAWGGPRSELFITTKINPTVSGKDPEASLNKSLAALGVDYVDLWLMHSPFFDDVNHGSTVEKVWKTMEKLQTTGKARAIGISNFDSRRVQDLLSYASIVPAVNQVELNPHCIDHELNKLCKSKGIVMASYSPLAPLVKTPDSPVAKLVEEIAKKHGVSAAQVLLKWSVQNGFITVCTTSNEERMKAFLELSFELTQDEMEKIKTEGGWEHHRYYWGKNYGEK